MTNLFPSCPGFCVPQPKSLESHSRASKSSSLISAVTGRPARRPTPLRPTLRSLPPLSLGPPSLCGAGSRRLRALTTSSPPLFLNKPLRLGKESPGAQGTSSARPGPHTHTHTNVGPQGKSAGLPTNFAACPFPPALRLQPCAVPGSVSARGQSRGLRVDGDKLVLGWCEGAGRAHLCTRRHARTRAQARGSPCRGRGEPGTPHPGTARQAGAGMGSIYRGHERRCRIRERGPRLQRAQAGELRAAGSAATGRGVRAATYPSSPRGWPEGVGRGRRRRAHVCCPQIHHTAPPCPSLPAEPRPE